MVKLLKQEYCFLSEKEQCDILVHVLKKLWYGTSGQKNEIAACKNDIPAAARAITENDTNTIILEGFMRFRMKDYLEAWEKELASCVQDYVRRKEYAEFVEILRLFIKIRIPRARKCILRGRRRRLSAARRAALPVKMQIFRHKRG
jgi:hypothetical protein